jgi:hypothetical protein
LLFLETWITYFPEDFLLDSYLQNSTVDTETVPDEERNLKRLDDVSLLDGLATFLLEIGESKSTMEMWGESVCDEENNHICSPAFSDNFPLLGRLTEVMYNMRLNLSSRQLILYFVCCRLSGDILAKMHSLVNFHLHLNTPYQQR